MRRMQPRRRALTANDEASSSPDYELRSSERTPMADDLVFYTNPMSRGRIVRWMLEEVGRPYRTEILAFGPEMKGAGFRAVNPMGKVPAIIHGGSVVTEAAAICAY